MERTKKRLKATATETNGAAALVPAPAASPSATAGDGRKPDAIRQTAAETAPVKKSSGFIFMCSRKTKPECYRFRVFGLPKAQADVVLKINKGAKLFLFDFNLKLLYGVYEASTPGGLNLEPSAFRGGFPAQIKFEILKDCLPLPESSFKLVISENYNSKGKFSPELNAEQVSKLLSLFQPIRVIQKQLPPTHYVEDKHHPHELPPKDSYKPRHAPRQLSPEDPYMSGHFPLLHRDSYRSHNTFVAPFGVSGEYPYTSEYSSHALPPMEPRYFHHAPPPVSLNSNLYYRPLPVDQHRLGDASYFPENHFPAECVSYRLARKIIPRDVLHARDDPGRGQNK